MGFHRGFPVAETHTDAALPAGGGVRGRGEAACGVFAAPKCGFVDLDWRGGIRRKGGEVAAQEEAECGALGSAERGVGMEVEVAHPDATGRVDALAIVAPGEPPHPGPPLARRECAHDEARHRSELTRRRPVPFRHAEGFAEEAAPGEGRHATAAEQRIGAGMGRGKPP